MLFFSFSISFNLNTLFFSSSQKNINYTDFKGGGAIQYSEDEKKNMKNYLMIFMRYLINVNCIEKQIFQIHY